MFSPSRICFWLHDSEYIHPRTYGIRNRGLLRNRKSYDPPTFENLSLSSMPVRADPQPVTIVDFHQYLLASLVHDLPLEVDSRGRK